MTSWRIPSSLRLALAHWEVSADELRSQSPLRAAGSGARLALELLLVD